jgi:hypothetical protein
VQVGFGEAVAATLTVDTGVLVGRGQKNPFGGKAMLQGTGTPFTTGGLYTHSGSGVHVGFGVLIGVFVAVIVGQMTIGSHGGSIHFCTFFT